MEKREGGGMTQGDPRYMSAEARAKGHASVVGSMSNRVAALAKASGTVSDHRRLVSFVYLLLRDNMSCGLMADIMMMRTTINSAKRIHLYQGFSRDELTERAQRLTDGPMVPVRDWLVLVYRQTRNADQVTALIDLLPVDDKTETVFTNGWLARYARYVAEELLALTEADGCPA